MHRAQPIIELLRRNPDFARLYLALLVALGAAIGGIMADTVGRGVTLLMYPLPTLHPSRPSDRPRPGVRRLWQVLNVAYTIL